MFDCCRIPGPQGLDWSVSYAKESDLGDSGHIIVFRNNRVWKVEVAKDGQLLSTHDMETYVTTYHGSSELTVRPVKFNISTITLPTNTQALVF